jgi:hypothetical protein
MTLILKLLLGLRSIGLYFAGLVKAAPWQSAVIALLVAIFLLWRAWSADHDRLIDQVGAANKLIKEERAAHDQTIRNVEQGRKAAAELDRKNAERVTAEAAAINERISDELEATVRTYADRERRLLARLAAPTVDHRGGASTPVPSDPDATCRAFGAADCPDLAARIADGQASIDRLIALQAWATAVSAIDIGQEVQ